MTDDELDFLDDRFSDLNARLSALSLLVKTLAVVIDERSPGSARMVREQIAHVAAEAVSQSTPERQRAVAKVAAEALRLLDGIYAASLSWVNLLPNSGYLH